MAALLVAGCGSDDVPSTEWQASEPTTAGAVATTASDTTGEMTTSGTSGSESPTTAGGTGSTGELADAGTTGAQDPTPQTTGSAQPMDAGGGETEAGEDPNEPPEETCPAAMEENPADADPCTAPLRPGEDRLCEFSYNGQTRKFYLYAPPSYNPCKPAAMVVDCHGATESAAVHIGVEGFNADSPLGYGSSWRRAVQGDNAIVVTPEGVGLFWSESQDPAFLNEVADMVEATADVDPEKRYLTGISMGGMVTVETGCQDSNRWRGMVPVAMLTNTCPSIERPVPHMAFHASTDSITSYGDSEELADQMVSLNGCDPTPETITYGGPDSAADPVCFETPYGPGSPDATEPYEVPLVACPSDRPPSSCKVWSGCDDGVEVAFCTIEAADQVYGGHLLYTNDTGLNLAALGWQFLKKFAP